MSAIRLVAGSHWKNGAPTMYAIFENNGLLDTRAFTAFGVNAKQGESPIGFFGTGLKYALAVCARERYPVFIQPGDGTEYQLKTFRDQFRGKDFEFLRLADKELPFTTELGKNWQPWMAFREFESNVRDENGFSSVWFTKPDPEEGTIRIIVGGGFAAHFDHWKNEVFFNSDHPSIVKTLWIEFIPIPSEYVYYRGIKAGKMTKPSIFTLNFITKMELTEDRTIKNTWDMDYYCRIALCRCTSEDLITKALLAGKDSMEHSFDFGSNTWDSTFTRVANRLAADKKIATLRLNVSVLLRVEKDRKERVLPTETVLDNTQEETLRRATEIASAICGTSLQMYPIIPTDELDNKILGLAKAQKIFISTRAIDEGIGQTAATIVEEWAHNHHNVNDHSRDFQDLLLRKLVAIASEALGNRIEMAAQEPAPAIDDEVPF
jgi:hypothetical protein